MQVWFKIVSFTVAACLLSLHEIISKSNVGPSVLNLLLFFPRMILIFFFLCRYSKTRATKWPFPTASMYLLMIAAGLPVIFGDILTVLISSLLPENSNKRV